ncbi:hypothetical protein IEQ34_023112 [Dendrobium chrysotoxum]|uniref:Uncharacterized protein n=1 Tax=Dendrobium chrysotoxum TaxID=161865 RepID=A0AAV7G1A6_DENCH|nr:hypothetical protein IEQ34_023112 [Dendrobium chrysotoxum]
MEAEDGLLALLDHYWFQTLILHRKSLPPPEPVTPAIAFDTGYAESLSSEPSPPPPPPDLLLRRHRRSRSDELAPFPVLQIQSPKLNTIFSGKVDAEYPYPIAPPAGENRERRFKRDLDRRGLRRRGLKGESRSLTDLEFEELKGLMDLGFTFPDAEEADPRLISIVPGLQRLREAALDRGDSVEETSSSASDVAEEAVVPRAPYLSEVWDAAEVEEERRNVLLRNWRIPAAGDGIDMKDHLRLWAHAVASAVR